MLPTKAKTLLRPVTLGTLLAIAAHAQPTAADQSGKASANEDVLQLNPFEVIAEKDNSYGALNSNSITSFKTELDKVPVSAEVFSRAFMDDVAATSVEDMIQGYSAGAGFSTSNPAGSASNLQPGDRNGGATLSLRGLASGSVLRDGFFPATSSGVGFTTNFDLERVEVIAGPQSLLYGAGGGGGVVNYMSKQARFNSKPSTEFVFRIDSYGKKLGSIDYGVGDKRFAVRTSFINQQAGAGRRDFIGGDFVGGYVELAARPVKNTTVRVQYEKTSYSRILSNALNLTAASTTDDARNGQKLHYLLATNQIDAAANGAPSGAGVILNGNVNWDNIDSLGGAMTAENRRLEFTTAQVDTVWTRWLSTKIAGGYSVLESSKIGNAGVSLLAPNHPNNPTMKPAIPATPTSPAVPAVPGDWVMSLNSSQTTAQTLWQPARLKNIRASAVVTNDLFGGRAHSQTVFGGDFTRRDTGGGGLGQYYVLADSDFHPIITPPVVNTSPTGVVTISQPNNGYTNIPVQYWSVNNGPVKYPLWGMGAKQITVNGQNYVLTETNPPDKSRVNRDTNPLGLSGYGNGSYRPSRSVQKGVYVANYTNWLDDRLTTLAGVRANSVDSLSFSENTGVDKLAIPSSTTKTSGTAVDYSLGATYRATRSIRPYIALSDAYSPPNSTAQDPYGRPQKATTAVGGELGVKVTNTDATISGSIAYFRTNAKNEQTSIDSSIREFINPAGLNGRLGTAPSNTISVDRTSEGVQVEVTANPTRNLRMRLSGNWQQSLVKSGGVYQQLYNDQFYANSSGQVTYQDGTVVYVNSTASKAQISAPGAAGAVPLTIAMMATPSTSSAPNRYYANPAANSGKINATSGAAIVLQGNNSFFPTGATTGTVDPNIAIHGPILTGAIGLPISEIQVPTPPGVIGTIGTIPVSAVGDRAQGSPQISVNYTAVYTFSDGWLRGLRLGGTYQGLWKYGAYYYYPNTLQKDPATRSLFQWPTKTIFNGIIGYEWKWRKSKIGVSVNVNNMFNHYHIVVLPSYTSGFFSGQDATFDVQPRSYVFSATVNF